MSRLWATPILALAVVLGACSSEVTPPASTPTVLSTPTAALLPTSVPAATPTLTLSPGPTAIPEPPPSPTATSLAASTATPTSTLAPTPTATPTSTAAPPSATGPLSPMDVERAFPGLSFDRMVFLTHPGDGTDRLFLVLQPGRIMVFPNQETVEDAQVFLDIRDRVNDRGNEEGLLGLAFDPDYASNGLFYIYYSASNPRRSVISRFSGSTGDPNKADPASEEVILEVPQPYANHNGGMLAFGPDGFLYISLGDGGAGGDPQGNGQDPGTLLGAILRIDPRTPSDGNRYSIPPDNPFVDSPASRKEIWAYGFRNPWRFSFDRETGELWVGDVGQNAWEEVDLILPGRNYGWNVMEGLHCFPSSVSSCDQAGLEPPIVEYPLSGGNCAVTGGYVYRGSRLPSLYGAYVYGDFCSGRIWVLRHDGQRVTDHALLVDSSLDISSFGEDASGEIYILSFDRRLYRLKATG